MADYQRDKACHAFRVVEERRGRPPVADCMPAPLCLPTVAIRAKAGHSCEGGNPASGLSFFILHAAFCIFLLLTGCVGMKKPPVVIWQPPLMPVKGPELRGDLALAGQYAPSTGARVGFNTYEVYLENKGTDVWRFNSVRFNGRTLAANSAPNLLAAFGRVTLDGEVLPLGDKTSHDKDVVWWQFYPEPELWPGRTILFQINMRGIPSAKSTLELMSDGVKTVAVDMVRFRMPEKMIGSIAFAPDYSRIYVPYSSRNGAGVTRVWLNNRLTPVQRELQERLGGGLRVLKLQASERIQRGDLVYVKLEFEDRDWRYGMVRALTGPILDAAEQAGRPTRVERRDYALDADSGVIMLPYDFTCNDVRHDNDKGGSATAMVMERQTTYHRDRSRLAGASYCTAMYPELWNIYGSLADAVFAKPYRLGYGHNPKRFIEEEEAEIDHARQTVQPRPWLYTPESYQHQGRIEEGEELEVLVWVMLAKGARGIRYHYWNHLQGGFFENRRLQETMKILNRRIGDARDKLATLIPAGESQLTVPCVAHTATSVQSPNTFAVPNPNSASAPLKVYTAWCGDSGLLVVARNLDYETDLMPDENGEKPRFRVNEKLEIDLPVPLPNWLRNGGVCDLVDGSVVEAREAPSADGRRELMIRLDRLPAVRALWVENR